MKCLNCGAIDVEKIVPENGGNYYLGAVNDDLDSTDSGLLVFVYRCKSCGFIHLSAPDIKKFLSI